MKKYMIAVILCTLITATFTGCKEHENEDISLESSQSESSFTTSTTTSVSSTEVATVKETAEISPKVESSATEITQSTAVPTIKETQAPSVNIAPKEKPVITEQVTTPQTKPIVTESPKPVVTSTPQTEKPAVTTATPKSETADPKLQKVLNEAFKQELTVYIQNYCKEVGLVYRDDGNTPDNSSWDIPARTRNCITNDEILEYVKGGARIVLINYGEGTVINLYFEDDWEADGEWRIYVLF